ncbi:TPA: hypothetical protein DEB00_01055 [Candidatus Uhrbacteria bacterium]|nr:hypothetical protein [Candidatus Uhrbacteria bacterium]
MISTLEILWIVLAFCVLWVTAFVCWAIYHIAMVARNIHLVLDEAKQALHQIEDAITGVKDKMEHHAKLLDPLIALAGHAIRNVKNNKED